MLRKSLFGMLAVVGLIAMTGATASAHGPGYGGYGYGHRHYRPYGGYGYGYRPPVVVAPAPVYVPPVVGGYGCRHGYGYGPGYGYAQPGIGVSTPGFGFYVR